MKLKILADSASEFYDIPDLRIKRKGENAHIKKARHTCQWIACDAGYNKSAIARFWGVDRTSVYYGCKIVNNRIDTEPAEKRELKEFMKLVGRRISGAK